MTHELRHGILVCSLFVAGCSQVLGLDLEGYHPKLPPEDASKDAPEDIGATEEPSGDVASGADADASLQDAPLRDAVADGDAPPPSIGAHLWSKRFGNKLGDVANGIATDSSGNVFLTGVFEGVVDFGGGPLSKVAADSGIEPGDDFMLAKYDSMGRHI